MSIEEAYVACHNAMSDVEENSSSENCDELDEQLINLSSRFIFLTLLRNGYIYHNGKYVKRSMPEQMRKKRPAKKAGLRESIRQTIFFK